MASFVRNAWRKLCNTRLQYFKKDKGISIFKVPLANSELNKKWSRDLINIILKYRQRDKSLNERNESHKLFIWKKHFTPTRYMFTLLVNHWKKVHYQLWIFLNQVPMQLIIVLQVLLKKEKNIHFHKHSTTATTIKCL